MARKKGISAKWCYNCKEETDNWYNTPNQMWCKDCMQQYHKDWIALKRWRGREDELLLRIARYKRIIKMLDDEK